MLSDTTPARRSAGRRAYVLKMYPRFSETFIVSEILAREAAGEDLVIFSLRPSTDARFHPELARVRAEVIHIDRPSSARSFWQTFAEVAAEPRMAAAVPDHLGDLVDLGHDDAIQALTLARLALDHDVTHLHAHFASVATTVARAASALTGIPYSFTTHAKDIFHEDVVLTDLARKTADADHVIAISEFNRRYLTTVLGPELADRVVVVRNGLELDRFPYRLRQGAMGEAPSLLAVGRLVEKKGFTHLLDALARLRGEGTSCHLDLVGTGPLEEQLRAQSRRLGLDDLVTFHGALTQAEVRDMLTDHDILVAPFVIGSDGNADGLPTVLLEGMATGIPCIAGTVTAVPEVIDHGCTGWLVDGTDVANIASTIAEVVVAFRTDPAGIRAVTDAARDRVSRLHDSTVQAEQLGRLAEAAADRAANRAGAAGGSAGASAASGAVEPHTEAMETDAANTVPTVREMESVS
ncbi:Glycosyltransferase involved in cell wall bisynthesis [Brevibacterium siliguriense]|uniref:Glycosyltransferase involved in cell wall bisynthesis n=1 Tax=Brevibacterium siliguriense TaxID=1136497 RepID=A0A1H1PFS9_9MICO|nr:glycosyltransferase family 4 protein [Brevibacterium siliguriense]SDS09865.1 Glycosyltransferase involved in cell wall bisynthesis [Brevibacterium siliguriense]